MKGLEYEEASLPSGHHSQEPQHRHGQRHDGVVATDLTFDLPLGDEATQCRSEGHQLRRIRTPADSDCRAQRLGKGPVGNRRDGSHRSPAQTAIPAPSASVAGHPRQPGLADTRLADQEAHAPSAPLHCRH
jgi:hypothetical protein